MKVQILIVTPRGTIYGKTEEVTKEEYNKLVEQMETTTEHISNGNLEQLTVENNMGDKKILPLQLLRHSYFSINTFE